LSEAYDKTEVGRLIFELGKLMRQYMRKNFEHEGITMPQSSVLGMLMKNGEMKITELSNKLMLSNSTVSGMIDRLEKQQLVERRRSEEDRRIVYVKASPKFLEMHKESHKKIEKSFEELLDTGTPEEIEKIIDGLKTLKKIVSECAKKD
jgi:DNA-binding MarR family transcriptional regulator